MDKAHKRLSHKYKKFFSTFFGGFLWAFLVRVENVNGQSVTDFRLKVLPDVARFGLLSHAKNASHFEASRQEGI